MQRIKKGDKVIVISGKFKKTVTDVTGVSGDMIYLKDVNIMKKAKKCCFTLLPVAFIGLSCSSSIT